MSAYLQHASVQGVAKGNVLDVAPCVAAVFGDVHQIPEPSTSVLAALGLLGLLAHARRRSAA